ncbi:MAG: DUF3822 family protein [Sphingomonadales bacterium]
MESFDKPSPLHLLFTYQASGNIATDSNLALQMGDRYASFAICERQQGSLQALGYVPINEWNPMVFDQFIALIDTILPTPFAVEISFDMAHLSMLPVANYEESKLQALHQSLFPFSGSAVFKTETMAEWQLQLGYTLPGPLFYGCRSRFPNARIRHAIKILLDNARQSDTAGKILVDIGMETFRVLLVKNNRLQLFQTYPYASPADVLYYLLSICEAQLVSPTDATLILTGLIEKDSALYRELWQYFKNLTLREATSLPVDFPFPAHYFTTINDLLLCAS